MSKVVDLLEHVQAVPAGGKAQIDRDAGAIKGVKILGESSRNAPPNDNLYPKATREKAAAVIEGQRVFVDHPAKGSEARTRSYRDLHGKLENVHEAGDGLYGDYRYNPKHPLTEQFLWDVEHNPTFGFSINARGRTARRGGRNLVEEIVQVSSVDLVSVPATTAGLFESLEPAMNKPVKEILKAIFKQPKQQKLLEEMEAAGAPMTAEAPPPASESPADSAEATKSAFKAMIVAAFEDEKLDMKATLKRISEIVKSYYKLTGESEPAEPPAETPATESLTPAQQLQRLQESFELKLKARDKAAVAGVVPGKALTKALDACKTEAEIDELIQEAVQTPAPRTGGPRSAASTNGGGKTQALTESFDDSAEARSKRLARFRGSV